MTYEVAQTCMLVNIGLTRSECASWVQAWGSIGAILAGIGFILLQHHLEFRRKAAEERRRVVARVAVFEEVARATAHHVGKLQQQLATRKKIDDIVNGEEVFDRDGLSNVDQWLKSLKVAELEDPKIVNGVMMLITNVRQFRDIAKDGLAHYRQMTAQEVDNFLVALSDCSKFCSCDARAIKGQRLALETGG